jgi:hypothetical protein
MKRSQAKIIGNTQIQMTAGTDGLRSSHNSCIRGIGDRSVKGAQHQKAVQTRKMIKGITVQSHVCRGDQWRCRSQKNSRITTATKLCPIAKKIIIYVSSDSYRLTDNGCPVVQSIRSRRFMAASVFRVEVSVQHTFETEFRLPRRFQWNEYLRPPSPFILSPRRGNRYRLFLALRMGVRPNPSYKFSKEQRTILPLLGERAGARADVIRSASAGRISSSSSSFS